jgi:hypothetical protein
MAVKKILTLGKSLKENIDDAYEKFVTGGGKTGKNKKITIQKKDIDKKIAKQKQVSKRAENLAKKQKKTKKVTPTTTSVKELASKAKQKRNIKSKVNKAEKVFSRKEYNKKLADTLKKNKVNKIPKDTKKKQSTALTITKQPSKKTGTNLVTIPKGTNIVKKKTTSLTTIPKSSGATTSNKILNFLKRNKGKIGLGAAASLLPFAIGTDKNIGEGSVIGGGKKDKKPKKDFTPKVKKPTTPEVKIKKLPKVKSNDYTGRFIDKKGNVAYDSFSDFMAHMTGKPKKRKMPKKTARIIGTGDKLKRKDADKKGAGKGVKFKAFKSGTKDKTVGLKSLPPKAVNPGIHMLPAKAKMNMGFKPMFGGGFISSLYDKPEKTEKYKGNTTSARQVKGYGKAKKKA